MWLFLRKAPAPLSPSTHAENWLGVCLIACGLIPELQKIQVGRASFRGAHVIRMLQSKKTHPLSEGWGEAQYAAEYQPLHSGIPQGRGPRQKDDPCSIHSAFTYLFQFPLQRIHTSCDSNRVSVCEHEWAHTCEHSCMSVYAYTHEGQSTTSGVIFQSLSTLVVSFKTMSHENAGS